MEINVEQLKRDAEALIGKGYELVNKGQHALELLLAMEQAAAQEQAKAEKANADTEAEQDKA